MMGNTSPQTNIDHEKCPYKEDGRVMLVGGKVHDITGREQTILFCYIYIYVYIIIIHVDLNTQRYIANNMGHPASGGCSNMVVAKHFLG